MARKHWKRGLDVLIERVKNVYSNSCISGSLPTREEIKSIMDDSLGCERFYCKGRGECTNTVGTTYTCKAVERQIDLFLKLVEKHNNTKI